MKSLARRKDSFLFGGILLAVCVFTLLLYITYGRPQFGIDDANITFAYAQNFANGNGFVYNVDGEKVEGFSSMLWVIITSAIFKFFPSPEFFILVFNVLCISFAFFYLCKYILDKLGWDSRATLFCGIFLSWVLAVPNFLAWSTISLMEFGLYSSVILCIVTVILKSADAELKRIEKYFLAALLLLLALIRPESLVLGPFFGVVYMFIDLTKTKSLIKTLRTSVFAILVPVISSEILILFRLAYFGYPVPNTYYAKVSGNFSYNIREGITYITNFINANNLAFMFIVLVSILSIVILGRIMLNFKKIEVSELQIFTLTAVVIMGCAVPILNGGDHFVQYRFMQPIWPILVVPALYLFLTSFELKLLDGARQKVLLIVSVIAIFFSIFYFSDNISWHLYKEQVYQTIAGSLALTKQERKEAEMLERFFSKLDRKPTVGVLAAGSIKMEYTGNVNDLLGLNNVAMAHANPVKSGIKNHAAFDKGVFYAQKPEALNLIFVDEFNPETNIRFVTDYPFWNRVLKDLYLDDKFQQEYTSAVIFNGNMNKYLFGIFENTLFEQIKLQYDFQIYTNLKLLNIQKQ